MNDAVVCELRGLSPGELLGLLAARGWEVIDANDDHVVLTDRCRRLVVPTHSQVVSDWVVRTIEWLLEPGTRAGWLRSADSLQPATEEPRGVQPLRFHAVFLDHGDRWDAFLVEEFGVLTFGSTVAEARSRLVNAIGLRFGVDPRQVELIEVERSAA
jgi:predicted RNase H-like HicB family nuclease